jgi:hypothetical protein
MKNLSIYLDDCADDKELAQRLRHAGYTVVRPREVRTAGLPDRGHLEYAAQSQLTLLTRNPDDFQDLHRKWQAAGRTHFGILLVYQDNNPKKDMSPADVVRAIGNLIASGLPIVNEIHTLNHWR